MTENPSSESVVCLTPLAAVFPTPGLGWSIQLVWTRQEIKPLQSLLRVGVVAEVRGRGRRGGRLFLPHHLLKVTKMRKTIQDLDNIRQEMTGWSDGAIKPLHLLFHNHICDNNHAFILQLHMAGEFWTFLFHISKADLLWRIVVRFRNKLPSVS